MRGRSIRPSQASDRHGQLGTGPGLLTCGNLTLPKNSTMPKHTGQPNKSDYDKAASMAQGLFYAKLGKFMKQPLLSAALLFWATRNKDKTSSLKVRGDRKLNREKERLRHEKIFSDAMVEAAKKGEAAVFEEIGKMLRFLKDDKTADPDGLAVLLRTIVERGVREDPGWQPTADQICSMLAPEKTSERKHADNLRKRLSTPLQRRPARE